MGIPIRVLIVEDSPDDAELILLQLRRAGYEAVSERVQTEEAMKEALEREPWDLVVSDYSMPRFDAPTALSVLNQSGRDVPFIVVSGSIGEDIAVAMMKTGAHDYVLKQNLARFVSAVQRELREAENRRQQRLIEQANQRLQIERDELLKRLKAENEDLAALTQVTAKAISTLELDDLLDGLLQRVMEVMHADTATILLAKGDELRVRASVGSVSLSDSTDVKLVGQGFAGAVAQRMQPVYVEDATTDPLITDPLIRERGIRSMLGVPLKRGGTLIGVLHADWLFAHPRRDREVHLLEITAERCSAAIQNAQLFQEAKCVTAALTERDRFLSTLVGNLPGMVYRCLNDPEWTMTFIGGSCREITGYERSDLEQNRVVSYASLVHPDDREWLWAKCQASLKARVQCNNAYRIVAKTGEIRWVQELGTGYYADDGALLGIEGFVQDITERKRADTGLRQSEERFRELAGHIDEVFWLTDLAKSQMIYISPAYETIWGRSCASVVASPLSWLDALHPDDRERVHQAALTQQAGGAYDIEYRITRPDGMIRWIHDRAFAVRDDAGEIYRIAGVATDVTMRKQAGDALRASLREKEALLKEVHHRVKNNLQVVTSLLRLEAGRSEAAAARIALKEMEGRIMAMALLHDTLYRSGTFAAVDLGAYFRELAPQSFRALNPRPSSIRLDMDLAVVEVGIDRAIPCGLLLNELISNGLKHGFPGDRAGAVRIELQPVPGGSQARLRVSDSGVGLPADFESRRGRSLGLQLVSDLARQIGGGLEVEPGPGAAFAVTFQASLPRTTPRVE